MIYDFDESQLQRLQTTDRLLSINKNLPTELQDCAWRMESFQMRRVEYASRTSSVCTAYCRNAPFTVAIKRYSLSGMDALQKLQCAREASMHVRMEHPSIIRMYAAWTEAGQMCMALEHAPIGTVHALQGGEGEAVQERVVAKFIVRPVLAALVYMHARGVVHRDIKPENVLLTPTGCKLTDLGLSITHHHERANSCLGTLPFMAPEVLTMPEKSSPMQFKDNPHARTYDEKVDVWAVGVLAYELVYGQVPFPSLSPVAIIQQMKAGPAFPVLPTGDMPSFEFKQFVKAALQLDPRSRPSALDIGRYPWIGSDPKRVTDASVEPLSIMDCDWRDLLAGRFHAISHD